MLLKNIHAIKVIEPRRKNINTGSRYRLFLVDKVRVCIVRSIKSAKNIVANNIVYIEDNMGLEVQKISIGSFVCSVIPEVFKLAVSKENISKYSVSILFSGKNMIKKVKKNNVISFIICNVMKCFFFLREF